MTRLFDGSSLEANEIPKRKLIYFPLCRQIVFVMTAILFFACGEDENDISIPTVSSGQVIEISYEAVKSTASITFDGGSEVIARGVCWSTSNLPTIDDSKTIDGSGSGNFTSTLTGLLPNTSYYLRAYATNSKGTAYGEEVRFTTDEAPLAVPTVRTIEISDIGYNTATSGGEISSDGGSDVTARGVVWSSSDATGSDDSITRDGTGTGKFTRLIKGLMPNTTYTLRAYATNSVGTAYGEEFSFTTKEEPVTLPEISTIAVSAIGAVSAISGGNIKSDGGSEITARGVCWSVSNSPTIEDFKTMDGTGSGNFKSKLEDLLPNTTYFLKAYATNSEGTSYGNEIIFTTGKSVYTGNVYLDNQQEVDAFGSKGYTKVAGDVIIEPVIPTQFSNLKGLRALTSIGGALIISKTIGLEDLSDLKNLTEVGDYIILSYNQGMRSIGLENLSSVGNYFNILLNDDLINLDGLSNLKSKNGKPDVTIWSNEKLKDFCGIKNLLIDFTGEFSVKSNLYNPYKQEIVEGNCSQ